MNGGKKLQYEVFKACHTNLNPWGTTGICLSTLPRRVLMSTKFQRKHLVAQKGKRININSHHPSKSFYQQHFYHVISWYGWPAAKMTALQGGDESTIAISLHELRHWIRRLSKCPSLTGTLLGKLCPLPPQCLWPPLLLSLLLLRDQSPLQKSLWMWREHTDIIRVPVSSYFLILIFCPWKLHLIPGN